MHLRLAAILLAFACVAEQEDAAPATTRNNAAAVATPADSAPPAGATARCRDGTYSDTKSTRGACSSHGGVNVWLITGTCKDGTVTRATTRQGACSGHGGVEQWIEGTE